MQWRDMAEYRIRFGSQMRESFLNEGQIRGMQSHRNWFRGERVKPNVVGLFALELWDQQWRREKARQK